jgi:hypothetical protein
MSLRLGKEPEGLLLRPQDITQWVRGLDRDQWRKVRPLLREVYVPGGDRPAYTGQRPFYRKSEIQRKLIQPILETGETKS